MLRRSLSIVLASLLLALILGTAALALWFRSEFRRPYYGLAEETYVDIPRGANANEIADLLTKSGVLHHKLPFVLYLRFTDKGRHIQAGEYRFCSPATPGQIAHRLVQGDIYFRSVTIPEGLTAREIIDLLAKNGLGNPDDMERALLRTDWILDLDPNAKNLEGYLFPETYRFGHKADSYAIIKAMVGQFRTKLSKIIAECPNQGDWSVSQIVILASMIEKEVKSSGERPLVASVLVNRLEKGIPLACDATIIYALKQAGKYDGRVHKTDLTRESPYNTYLHPNLPPGPISNPGADSLCAALNPAKTQYFYYVSRNDGTHQFSTDLSSHLRAINRYQKAASGAASGRKVK